MENLEYGFSREEDVVQLEALEKRLQENPNDTDALLKKAILYYEPFLRTDESITIFRSIIAKNSQNVDAYFWLAKCLWHYRFDFKEAERLLRIALTIDPNRADCHLLLGIILDEIIDLHLTETGKLEPALVELQKSIELHFLKAIELEPTWIIPRDNLAHLFLEKGEFQQAKDQIIESLKYVIDSDDTPEIKDAITKHYETFVTGRYRKELKADLLDFLKEIDLAIEQKKNSKNPL